MASQVAGNSSNSLLPELFKASVYKGSQGRMVRQLTCLTLLVVVALGCKSLYDTLQGSLSSNQWLGVAVPGVCALLGFWTSYRLVNWPRFADFLISVEGELNKVSWPSKAELYRASVVVIFTIFFLAVSLYTFDIIWQLIFETIGIAS